MESMVSPERYAWNMLRTTGSSSSSSTSCPSEREKSRLALAEYKIGALNPAALLEKGYAVVADSQGRRIMSAGELPESGQIRLFMKDGIARLQIRVIDITENK